MAHLFLASKISIPDDSINKSAPKVPKSAMKMPTSTSEKVITEKSNNNNHNQKDRSVVVTTVPLINEVQLTAATGGAEMSCYRCTVPFGVVVLIAGIVVTAVAYTFNSHGRYHLGAGAGSAVGWPSPPGVQCCLLEGPAGEEEGPEEGESDGPHGQPWTLRGLSPEGREGLLKFEVSTICSQGAAVA